MILSTKYVGKFSSFFTTKAIAEWVKATDSISKKLELKIKLLYKDKSRSHEIRIRGDRISMCVLKGKVAVVVNLMAVLWKHNSEIQNSGDRNIECSYNSRRHDEASTDSNSIYANTVAWQARGYACEKSLLFGQILDFHYHTYYNFYKYYLPHVLLHR